MWGLPLNPNLGPVFASYYSADQSPHRALESQGRV